MNQLLDVTDLSVSFNTYAGEVKAVRGINLQLSAGETLAIVGESGSGKSVTSRAIMRILKKPGKITGGRVLYNGKDLTTLSDKAMQKIRGAEISMVFQDAMTSLNPTMTIGRQISEGLKKHQKLSSKEAKTQTVELLKKVEIPNPEVRYKQYPHQFSGGMRQRAVIAMALACNPKVLIADEPTTALDVTIQGQILELLRDLQNVLNMGIIFITHDLGVVANLADRVAVMYAGVIVETGTVDELFYNPKHPYLWGLLASMPKLHMGSKLRAIPGTPPNLLTPPLGCPFAARCPYAMKVCLEEMPARSDVSPTHSAACWLLDTNAPSVSLPQESIVGGEVYAVK
ncbi:ABC transporter ATP-binding protein [Sporosarcina oncorhynchi]|uniref:ABC transporter ATP-binding protein n=1 Tax=Sporosarcina oncorhynchi TaxID=3056444 RepID=A0ABZ0L9B1_9BACL|nr:ABC transporter ATP-binding protein [Sporosarcina sp. T2O-4]WOV88121.1 ABC transporter ATP-binding protein [Sporosarcina sp. T2O-4]